MSGTSVLYNIQGLGLKIVKTYETLYFCGSNNLQKFEIKREGITLSALICRVVEFFLNILVVGEIKQRTFIRRNLRVLENPSFGNLIWKWDKYIEFEAPEWWNEDLD